MVVGVECHVSSFRKPHCWDERASKPATGTRAYAPLPQARSHFLSRGLVGQRGLLPWSAIGAGIIHSETFEYSPESKRWDSPSVIDK